MISLLESLCAGLAAIGLIASLYLIFAGRRKKGAANEMANFLPWKWRQTSKVSTSLDKHPSARLLGVRNEALTAVYYLLVIIAIASQYWIALWVVRCFAILALLISAYLVFTLSYKLKQRCILCFVLNAINAMLATLLWNLPNPA